MQVLPWVSTSSKSSVKGMLGGILEPLSTVSGPNTPTFATYAFANDLLGMVENYLGPAALTAITSPGYSAESGKLAEDPLLAVLARILGGKEEMEKMNISRLDLQRVSKMFWKYMVSELHADSKMKDAQARKLMKKSLE